MILVDTNVLIDLLQDDPQWADWSEEQLLKAQKLGPLFINAVGYAELVPALDTMAALDDFLKRSKIVVKDISRPAAFLAGEAFLQYRKRKGTKTGFLADFFMGSQAHTEGWKILTRDQGRYKTYFPKVKLICP
jgi:predicted nucleic acid-binding protein